MHFPPSVPPGLYRVLLKFSEDEVMTPRQVLAITRPLNEAMGDTSPYRHVRKHATGLLTLTILAVDR